MVAVERFQTWSYPGPSVASGSRRTTGATLFRLGSAEQAFVSQGAYSIMCFHSYYHY